MNIILTLFFILVFLSSFVHSYPSDETIDCLAKRIINDCKDMKIIRCNESGACFRNESITNDKKIIKQYISSWIKEWESQGILVQASYTPLICTKDFTGQYHSFRVDSNYYPIWDNQQFSCYKKYNLTIIGISLISEGGVTLIGIGVIGVLGITIIGGSYIFLKNKFRKKKTLRKNK